MQTRKLGPFTVSAVGLGAMPLSMGDKVSETREQAIATVHAALDAGVTYIDTADIYAPSWDTMGHNEEGGRRGAGRLRRHQPRHRRDQGRDHPRRG